MTETIATTGSYSSEDGQTSYSWAMPDYSDIQRAACRVGGHIASRRVVVKGWVGYFSQIKRAYCACGSKCWIWYETGWVDQDDGEPGGHLRWIEGRIEMDRTMAEHRSWEEQRFVDHGPDCYGAPRKCISCGCNKRGLYGPAGPCVSHR